MIDGSEKRNRQLAFELQNSHVCEKCSDHFCSRFAPQFLHFCDMFAGSKFVQIHFFAQ